MTYTSPLPPSSRGITFGTSVTQTRSFPFIDFIAPADYDLALRALQSLIEAQQGWGVLNPANWLYVGLGGDAIAKFLNDYLLYARQTKTYITTSTFMDFKSGMTAQFPDLAEEGLNVWLPAMVQCYAQQSLPDSIMRPWLYVPDSAPIVTTLSEALAKAGQAVGGVAGAAVKPFLGPVLLTAGAVAVIYLLGSSALQGKMRGAYSKAKAKGKALFS